MPSTARARTRATLLLVSLGLVLGAACGGGDDEAPDFSAEAIATSQSAEVTAILASSPPAVGPARLSFGIFDKQGQLVSTAEDVEVRLYTLEGSTGTLVTEQRLTPITLGDSGATHEHATTEAHLHQEMVTVYTAYAELTRPEWWGAVLSFTLDGERYEDQALRFFVVNESTEPAVGAQVPATQQKTTQSGLALADLDTSPEPNAALHDMTIAAAIASGRPSVIAFATPAFCQTRFCGPIIEEVVTPTWERYRDRVNVLHVEPYDVPAARQGALKLEPVMTEWGLQTEPWVFVLDGEGRVLAKFEGVTSLDEVTSAVDRALG